MKDQAMNEKNVWLNTTQEKLESLIADEAKVIPILTNLETSIRQLKAKSSFRLALLNQLLEKEINDGEN
jgi:hypothetical protein